MPWFPDLFSAPVVQRALDKQGPDEALAMPFFEGLLAGEPEALIGSFASEPELHDPVRGRIKGAAELRAYVDELSAWLLRGNAEVEDVRRVILDRHGFEEVVLHVDGAQGRVAVPFALVADHPDGPLLQELRLYYSTWPLDRRRVHRPPLLQRDPALAEPDVVAEHLAGLAAGDVDTLVATFEPDGSVRDAEGDEHRGPAALRAFYERACADGAGVTLEPCALVDDGRAGALEHNVVGWGGAERAPQAGMTVYVRGSSGRLAGVSGYSSCWPPSMS